MSHTKHLKDLKKYFKKQKKKHNLDSINIRIINERGEVVSGYNCVDEKCTMKILKALKISPKVEIMHLGSCNQCVIDFEEVVGYYDIKGSVKATPEEVYNIEQKIVSYEDIDLIGILPIEFN